MRSFIFRVIVVAVLYVALAASVKAGLIFRRGGRCCGGASSASTQRWASCSIAAVPAASGSGSNGTCPVCPANDSSFNVPAIGQLGGVDRSTGVGTHDGVCVGGQCFPPSKGLRKFQVPLPEDAAKPYVVIVGDEEFQAKARSILERHKLAEVYHVVSYDEGAWQAKDVGYERGVFFVGGRGTDGKAKVMSGDTDLGELDAALAQNSETIRRPDGILDRKVLPTLKKSLDPGTIIVEKAKGYVPTAIGGLSLLMLGLAVARRGG